MVAEQVDSWIKTTNELLSELEGRRQRLLEKAEVLTTEMDRLDNLIKTSRLIIEEYRKKNEQV